MREVLTRSFIDGCWVGDSSDAFPVGMLEVAVDVAVMPVEEVSDDAVGKRAAVLSADVILVVEALVVSPVLVAVELTVKGYTYISRN